MSDAVRSYLLGLVAAAFIGAVSGAVLPKGNARKLTQFVCGLLFVMVLVRPFGKLDYALFSQSISKSMMQAQQTENRVRVENRDLVSTIIKQNTEAYILDKAQAENMDVTVEVVMDGNDTYPYPCAVKISGTYTASQQAALEKYMEQELGIPPESQEWNTA